MSDKPTVCAELLPCPFCGSSARLEDHRLVWCVRCTKCSACVLGDRAPEPHGDGISSDEVQDAQAVAMSESTDWAAYEKSAVDAWNDRNARAAQHQGEPVAEVERAEGDLPHVQIYQDLVDGTRLYAEQPAPVSLAVWYGSMPESNGKSNWTAILHRKGDGEFPLRDISGGITIDRSEYPDRVRYEADCMRYLIGELAVEPDILEYDERLHSGYGKQPVSVADPELLGRFPEINFANYGQDEVEALQAWAFEAYAALKPANSTGS